MWSKFTALGYGKIISVNKTIDHSSFTKEGNLLNSMCLVAVAVNRRI